MLYSVGHRNASVHIVDGKRFVELKVFRTRLILGITFLHETWLDGVQTKSDNQKIRGFQNALKYCREQSTTKTISQPE